MVTVNGEANRFTLSLASTAVAFGLPATSVMELPIRRGCNVPLPEATADTVKVELFTGVMSQVTPVAVPVLPRSAAVNELESIASLKVKVKFTGTEFVSEDCPTERENPATTGATLSLVKTIKLKQLDALLTESTALA